MAVHYTERAALLDLPASKKLVLMCIADSANQDNRVGFPGMDAIKRWSGLKNSRALEVIAELVAEGYLVRHRGGVNGRRAEFIVFPHGCCPLHEPLPGYSAHLPGDDLSGSGVADPDDPAEKSQPPVEGPAEGPTQTGPLPNSVTPSNTSAVTEREQGSGHATDEPSPPPVAPSPASPFEDDNGTAGSDLEPGVRSAPAGPGRSAWEKAKADLAARRRRPDSPPARRPSGLPRTAGSAGA